MPSVCAVEGLGSSGVVHCEAAECFRRVEHGRLLTALHGDPVLLAELDDLHVVAVGVDGGGEQAAVATPPT
jgi:hypothetical protein